MTGPSAGTSATVRIAVTAGRFVVPVQIAVAEDAPSVVTTLQAVLAPTAATARIDARAGRDLLAPAARTAVVPVNGPTAAIVPRAAMLVTAPTEVQVSARNVVTAPAHLAVTVRTVLAVTARTAVGRAIVRTAAAAVKIAASLAVATLEGARARMPAVADRSSATTGCVVLRARIAHRSPRSRRTSLRRSSIGRLVPGCERSPRRTPTVSPSTW